MNHNYHDSPEPPPLTIHEIDDMRFQQVESEQQEEPKPSPKLDFFEF